MNYLSELASMALMSKGNKIFTIEDGHDMTITPAGDGKTMNISIDDGVSYKTKGVRSFIKKIESRNIVVRRSFENPKHSRVG